tara:strand:+ start:229 stop:831 length:603 start_codon:yes stop_codon:yes gene_type:complete
MDFIQADSLTYLEQFENISNIVTGIPDMTEINLNEKDYISFLENICSLIFSKTKGYVIFIQTDRKKNGIIDKSYLLTNFAYKHNFKMMWHKIALLRDVGKIDIYRPTYCHILCYSKNLKPGKATPDVIDGGKKSYKNATPSKACQLAIDFVKSMKTRKYGSYDVIDPFSGSGTIPKYCYQVGLTSLGVDLKQPQAFLHSR